MSTLTHFDDQGQAHMVDVAAKVASLARAGGRWADRTYSRALLRWQPVPSLGLLVRAPGRRLETPFNLADNGPADIFSDH